MFTVTTTTKTDTVYSVEYTKDFGDPLYGLSKIEEFFLTPADAMDRIEEIRYDPKVTKLTLTMKKWLDYDEPIAQQLSSAYLPPNR